MCTDDLLGALLIARCIEQGEGELQGIDGKRVPERGFAFLLDLVNQFGPGRVEQHYAEAAKSAAKPKSAAKAKAKPARAAKPKKAAKAKAPKGKGKGKE